MRPCGRRAWHPDFPLAALTVPGLKRAVAEAAAAQRCERARAQASKRRRSASAVAGQGDGEPAAPAYAPSGVFAGGAAGEEAAEGPGAEQGAGAACAGAAGAGAPRPPQLLRRHEPCKDTTPMDTEAFLAHLKTLSWYRDQARALSVSRTAWSPPPEVICHQSPRAGFGERGRLGDSLWLSGTRRSGCWEVGAQGDGRRHVYAARGQRTRCHAWTLKARPGKWADRAAAARAGVAQRAPTRAAGVLCRPGARAVGGVARRAGRARRGAPVPAPGARAGRGHGRRAPQLAPHACHVRAPCAGTRLASGLQTHAAILT